MFEDYLEQVKIDNRTKSTIETYYSRLKIYNEYTKNNQVDVLNATTKDILQFKNYLLKRGLSQRYINSILSVVRNFYDFLIVHEERSEFNPVLNSIKSRAIMNQPHVLTREEEQNFISWASTLQKNIYVGFLLMLKAGCRVSEVCNLTLSDCRLNKEGALMINIKEAKWGSDREVPLMDSSAALFIYEHLKELDISSKPITRCTPRTMQTYATKYATLTNTNMSCHTLRHTFATRLLEDGVPIEQIRRLMGHKTINMTAHYTQQAKINFKHIAPTIWQAD